MPITEMQIKSVLAQARTHYKGGYKSSNKVYTNEDTPKAKLRNDIVYGTDADPHPVPSQIVALRKFLKPFDLTMQRKGEFIINSGITYGNCGEMAAVALQICRLQIGPGVPAFTATLQPPGDHIFLVLSADGSSPSPRAFNAYQLSRENPTNFWVIDCWSNVAGSVKDYPNQLRAKFSSWANQEKRIVGTDGDEVDPSSAGNIHNFLGSTIKWKRRA